MDAKAAAETYLQEAVESAPPLKLVCMLYDGVIKAIHMARQENPHDPTSDFLNHVQKADSIIVELRLALDPEHAPEVASELHRLYIFAESRLNTAFARRELGPLDDVERVIRPLREAWKSLDSEQAKAA